MPFLVKDLKILLVHLVIAVMSKKGLVLDLNITVEVTEGSEKDELTLKQVMTTKRYKYSLSKEPVPLYKRHRVIESVLIGIFRVAQ